MNRIIGACHTLILLAGIAAGPLYALDRLPTPSCQDRDNLRLLRQCDPYAVRLLRVESGDLLPEPSRRRVSFAGTRSSETLSYPFERRLSFEKLVERYIDYQESLLRLRRPPIPGNVAIQAESNISETAPPKPRSEPLPVVKAPPVEQSVGGEVAGEPVPRAPTLAEYLGDRNVSAMLMPLSRRTGSYPSELLPPVQPPKLGTVSSPKPREAVRHTVEPGETLIALARRYQTTVYDIRRWNRLKRDHLLKVGEKLTIHPGKKTPPDRIKEAQRREGYGRYTVVKGDSLIGIARRFGVKRSEISELNNLKKGRHLRVGQKLLLPLKQKKIDAILKKERKFKYASDKRFKRKIRVIATAYTSHRSQTDKTPFLAAWNNRIRPGMKIIAVSPDLIRKYGITNGTKVKISGLPGVYTVRDKMNRRLKNHIDIYMGTNRRKALRWGRRRVVLYW